MAELNTTTCVVEGGDSEFQGNTHVLSVRVYFEDTDAGGVVYYANYLKFAERARTAMLRLGGWENGRLAAGTYPGQTEGVFFVMRHCTLDYRRSAVLDDLLQVKTRVVAVGGVTLKMAQSMYRGDEQLVNVTAKLGCVSATTHRPARIPAAMKADLTARLSQG